MGVGSTCRRILTGTPAAPQALRVVLNLDVFNTATRRVAISAHQVTLKTHSFQ